ncbi:MAG TPA: LPS assembly lipoprotein LptE [Sphingomicrobium sp.]|nr:LPS assembly lipoprotein LptE [Sphingomicrobium sp.]
MIRRLALLFAIAATVAGCQLHPLYAGGSSGPVAEMLRHVSVAPIPGRAGWLVFNKLKEQIGAAGDAHVPTYRLDVELDDEIVGLAIRGDRAATRERRILRARYQLVQLSNGQVLLDATAGSDAGIDVVSSEYATVAAEQTAEERLAEIVASDIVERLGLYAVRTGARP